MKSGLSGHSSMKYKAGGVGIHRYVKHVNYRDVNVIPYN